MIIIITVFISGSLLAQGGNKLIQQKFLVKIEDNKSLEKNFMNYIIVDSLNKKNIFKAQIYFDSLYRETDENASLKNLLLTNYYLLKTYNKENSDLTPDSSSKKIAAKIAISKLLDENKNTDNDFLRYLNLLSLKKDLEENLSPENKAIALTAIGTERRKCDCNIYFDEDFRDEKYKDFRLYIVDRPVYMEMIKEIGKKTGASFNNSLPYPSPLTIGISTSDYEELTSDIEAGLKKIKNIFDPAVLIFNSGNVMPSPNTLNSMSGIDPLNKSYIKAIDMDDANWYIFLIIKGKLCYQGELNKCTLTIKCLQVKKSNITIL